MKKNDKLLRVGEVAKTAGKTVRAIHLYEELGLLRPVSRTSGGFRLFGADAVDRINWITKLQAIGFSLSEIQGFVQDFEAAASGRTATARVREIFGAKLEEVRQQITQLQVIENDLVEALDYLESCQACAVTFAPTDCHVCEQQGHEPGAAPELFAALSRVRADGEPEALAEPDSTGRYDVDITKLRRGEGAN
jgi:MerR family transcriptional regulator, copper efflux regulator